MNNYPPGAAHDPTAPYNREEAPEVDVTVKELLVKQTCILSCGGHYETDCDHDPTEGRSVSTSYWEPGDVEEEFKNQCRTAESCLADCCKVLSALKQAGIRFVAKVNIESLLDDCEGWEEVELETSPDLPEGNNGLNG